MRFTCQSCGAKLEAHVAATTGPGGAGYSAECPRCKVRNMPDLEGFPNPVIEVVEVAD